MATFVCRVQFLDDTDPFNSTNFPEPTRAPHYTFREDIPLINQIAGVHRLLRAPHKVCNVLFFPHLFYSGLMHVNVLFVCSYINLAMSCQSQTLPGGLFFFNINRERGLILQTGKDNCVAASICGITPMSKPLNSICLSIFVSLSLSLGFFSPRISPPQHI